MRLRRRPVAAADAELEVADDMLRAEELVPQGGSWNGLLFDNPDIGLAAGLTWTFEFRFAVGLARLRRLACDRLPAAIRDSTAGVSAETPADDLARVATDPARNERDLQARPGMSGSSRTSGDGG